MGLFKKDVWSVNHSKQDQNRQDEADLCNQ
jgi:hypothetical protein